MKQLSLFVFTLLILGNFSCSTDSISKEEEQITDEDVYFPPLQSTIWETKSPEELHWNTDKLPQLLSYLEETNTKGFIILHQGKIVVEQYMNAHDSSKVWYWASAGKTLTTATTGIAQKEGLLAISDKVSDYLGTGWTSSPLAKENLITIENLLQMDSGLSDTNGDNVSPDNLEYMADAGTRWAYHNLYVKLQDVIATTSNTTYKEYFNTKLRDKIGMSGTWIDVSDLNVYWSDTRSMARFGLLISENGRWENTQIIPSTFLNAATNTSQNINEAYGYLWWLNGKSSYHLPQSQGTFDGSLIPNAPTDMYAALGKNDQKLYIIPSKDLVIIRMGDSAEEENFALSSYDTNLWDKINDLLP